SFNWAEDFVEYITFYYLTQYLNVNYIILVKENGEIIYSYEPMKANHIIARSKMLDTILLSSID
ncbi:MAG: ATP-dependent helicase, partial [Spirochaetota bacterium]